jgi:hypothetical protein
MVRSGLWIDNEKGQVQLLKEVVAAGFDPVAVGELYAIPLSSCRKNEIFYARELAEIGHSQVEG